MHTTSGTLLGGRVTHHQPAEGHRTGIEPVLLAAAIPARAGDLVLEGGTGSGAGLLCLAARIPGVRAIGVERDADMAAIARLNVAASGFDAAIEVADILEFRPSAALDHAFANPPWHAPDGSLSPVKSKEDAKRGQTGGVARWIVALATGLRSGGTLSLIVPPSRLPECLSALATARCGTARILPLWPRSGREARLLILHAVVDGRGACRLLPGLVLHGDGPGGYTSETAAILRDGLGIAMG